MIPDREILYSDEKGVVEMPSFTYAIEFEREDEKRFTEGRISGNCDGIAAIKQAVYKILRTEKDGFIIYKNYGTEHMSLIGKPRSFALPELERMIKEALLRDSRIKDVDGFMFGGQGGEVTAEFTVHSIFGKFNEVIGIV